MPLELIVGAAAGAAVASPPVRQRLRQGLVYGLAGLLVAYDKVAAVASGVVQSARRAVASSGEAEKAGAATAATTAAPPAPEAGPPR
jgi:hypothetical protein